LGWVLSAPTQKGAAEKGGLVRQKWVFGKRHGALVAYVKNRKNGRSLGGSTVTTPATKSKKTREGRGFSKKRTL